MFSGSRIRAYVLLHAHMTSLPTVLIISSVSWFRKYNQDYYLSYTGPTDEIRMVMVMVLRTKRLVSGLGISTWEAAAYWKT